MFTCRYPQTFGFHLEYIVIVLCHRGLVYLIMFVWWNKMPTYVKWMLCALYFSRAAETLLIFFDKHFSLVTLITAFISRWSLFLQTQLPFSLLVFQKIKTKYILLKEKMENSERLQDNGITMWSFFVSWFCSFTKKTMWWIQWAIYIFTVAFEVLWNVNMLFCYFHANTFISRDPFAFDFFFLTKKASN